MPLHVRPAGCLHPELSPAARVARVAALLLLLSAPALLAQESAPRTLTPVVVSATRAPQAADDVPVAVTVFSQETLGTSPSLALDDVLRGSAAFSLFRRSGSLTANPTVQGVSLRGIGPSGASRSLVLLDGIPLNDPFGGWIAWSKLPRDSLARVEIVRGGGSAAWGNAALGGTVQLLSQPLETDAGALTGTLGDFSTRSAELTATRVLASGRDAVRVAARAFASDGFPLVAPDRRGSIDLPADNRHRWAQATWHHRIGEATTLAVNARAFTEERGNGTPLQRNASTEQFLSAALDGAAGPLGLDAWSLVAYAQNQSFESFFSGVSTDRTGETPANNQFDVPAQAAGAALTATWNHAADARTTAGGDLRRVKGETREDFTYQNGNFTRRRFAGGEQRFAGAFLHHDRALAPAWHGSLGARVDYWQNRDGHRREYDRATGASVRDETFAAQEGVEFSPQLGVVWRPAPGWRGRAAVYRAFRLPTLNEYYRPFRVGNAITEANPALKVESLTGGEIGAEWGGPAAALAVTGFINQLDDAVTNVTVARGPGNVPGFGFIPAGGTGRQRRNLDAIRVRGLEVTARWQPSAWSALTLDADYLLNDGRVTQAAAPATLTGNRLAQVPRHTLSAGARWRGPAGWQAAARVRWTSAQFEDDENTLTLDAATTVDVSVSRRFARQWEVFAAVENAFDATVETGGTADGVVSIAPPRFAHGGVRWTW